MPGRKAPEETRRQDILRAAYGVAARQGVEAITVRAVAERAEVSHGTVLFHFKKRDELVATLLNRVLYKVAELRIPDEVKDLPTAAEQLLAVVRTEMARLSDEPRHFRLFLEYWSLGVRSAPIRHRVSAALETYRSGFRELAAAALAAEAVAAPGGRSTGEPMMTPEAVAAVAVSLVHGCALQSVIDRKRFAGQQHFDAATRMLEGIVTSPYAA